MNSGLHEAVMHLTNFRATMLKKFSLNQQQLPDNFSFAGKILLSIRHLPSLVLKQLSHTGGWSTMPFSSSLCTDSLISHYKCFTMTWPTFLQENTNPPCCWKSCQMHHSYSSCYPTYVEFSVLDIKQPFLNSRAFLLLKNTISWAIYNKVNIQCVWQASPLPSVFVNRVQVTSCWN